MGSLMAIRISTSTPHAFLKTSHTPNWNNWIARPSLFLIGVEVDLNQLTHTDFSHNLKSYPQSYKLNNWMIFLEAEGLDWFPCSCSLSYQWRNWDLIRFRIQLNCVLESGAGIRNSGSLQFSSFYLYHISPLTKVISPFSLKTLSSQPRWRLSFVMVFSQTFWELVENMVLLFPLFKIKIGIKIPLLVIHLLTTTSF